MNEKHISVIVAVLILLCCSGCGTMMGDKLKREFTTVASTPPLSAAWHPTTWDWKFFEPLNPVQWGGYAACAGLVAMDDAQTAGFRGQRGMYEGDPLARAFIGSRPKTENIFLWSGLAFTAYSGLVFAAPNPIRNVLLAGCIGLESVEVGHNAGGW